MSPRKAPHDVLKLSIPATMLADVTDVASRLTRAERTGRDARDAGRNLLAIGLDTVSRCPSCVAGIVCGMHGTEALVKLRGNEAAPVSNDVDGIEYEQLVSCYFVEFTNARGQGPAFVAADGEAAKKLLKAVGIARAEQAIRTAYASRYFKAHSTIRTIAADPSRHLGEATATSAGSTLQADSGFGVSKVAS